MDGKACGIICEYNPFHNGHRYQLDYARQTLGLPVVCAMSGAFVQRGEPASFPKNVRADEACRNGASVVLEIPFPFSALSAERFAAAGVRILTDSGMCSHLLFGSECADIGLLSEIAAAVSDPTVKKSIQVYQKEHPEAGYARARTAVLEQALGESAARSSMAPNDILAVEYLKAIRASGAPLIPVAMKRTCERNESPQGAFASSTAIRALLAAGDRAAAGGFVPEADALSAFTKHHAFYETLHAALMLKTPEDLCGICEVSGGMEHAIIRAARTSGSYAQMFAALRCKTHTDAKIRRALLFSFFGVTARDAAESPAYTTVLALAGDESAAELLRIARREKRMIVAQRVSAVRADKTANRQYERCNLAENVLAACLPLSKTPMK